jgi:prepilin-type N-terminal cleavage/methylation domain-containing protein
MRRQDCRKRGFSLIESLVAVLILGVGITGMAEGITAALRASKAAERHTAAALLASGRLEEIRAEGYLVVSEPGAVADDSVPPPAADETPPAGEPPPGRSGDGMQAREEPRPLYSVDELVMRTPTDGLYEVTVVVRLAATGEKLHEAKTLLFDAAASSGASPSNTRYAR